MQKSLGIRIPSGAFWAAEGGEESGDGRGGCGRGCWCWRQRVGPIISARFPVDMKDSGGEMDGVKP